MSRQRIITKLRKQAYFKPIMALLAELGVTYQIEPPRGRGHAILKFSAAGGEHRIPLPGSPSGRLRGRKLSGRRDQTPRKGTDPMSNVIDLPVITKLDLDPARVLAKAVERRFERVLIIGVLADGSEYHAASAADGGTLLWDMERTRHALMKIADEAEG